MQKSVLNRNGISPGMVEIKEHEPGIQCVNDVSERQTPRAEDKHPELLESIRKIM